MNRLWPSLRYSVFALLSLSLAAGLTGQVQQPELVRALVQGNAAERDSAVATLGLLDGATFTPELRLAAITAFEREAGVYRRLKVYGNAMGPWDLRSFVTLTRVVAGLRDSTVVQSLVAAIGLGGAPVVRALADFGEVSVQPLVAQVGGSPNSGDVMEELLALRAIVERSADHPLSAGAQAGIRQVTGALLIRSQEPGILWRAIDLGIALQDPALRQMVEGLATDSTAILARGITDPSLVESVQRRAAQRLAGIPAAPAIR